MKFLSNILRRVLSLHTRGKIALGIICLLSVWMIAGLAIGYHDKKSENVNNDIKTENSAQLPVNVIIKDIDPIDGEEFYKTYGAAKPYMKFEFSPRVGGEIRKIYREEGVYVKRGEPILEIEDEVRRARLDAALSSVELKENEYNAIISLKQKGLAAEKEKITALYNLRSARYELASARKELEDSVVKSPVDGRIEKQSLLVGDWVNQQGGAKDLITVANFDRLEVSVYLSEDRLAEINFAKQAKICFGNSTSKQKCIEGVIKFVSRIEDNTTKAHRVKIQTELIPVDFGRLYEGAAVDVFLPVSYGEAHLLHTSYLTLGENGTTGVKFLDKDDIAHFSEVKILAEKDGRGLIVKGLKGRVRIVTIGQSQISEGQKAKYKK